MKISDLEVFLSVANELSFSETARKLYISQSAVSQNIRKTEEELGFPLFQRSKHSVRLTEQGSIMKDAVGSILQSYRQAVSDCARIGNGRRTISIYYVGTINLHVLPRILGKLRKEFPNTDFSTSRLMPNDVSVLFARVPDSWFLIPRYLTPENIQAHFYPVYHDSHYCVMNRDNPLSGRTTVDYQDLDGHGILTPNPSLYPEHLKPVIDTISAMSLNCPLFSGGTVDNVIANLLSDYSMLAIMPGYTRPVHPDLVSIPFNSGIHICLGIAMMKTLTERERVFIDIAQSAFESLTDYMSFQK